MVDSIQFAKQHANTGCSVAVHELKRLDQIAHGGEGNFVVSLEGFEDSEGRPGLHLHVAGTMTVTCQRCLEPLVLDIVSDRNFMLVKQEQELQDLSEEADDVESLVADSKLNVLELAEDEILLQIPIAPMHADDSCVRPGWDGDSGNKNSAFSVLGALTNTKD
ncbi:MAG: DUF177 domain-containing protein [Burkholderiales bacterium]